MGVESCISTELFLYMLRHSYAW